LALCCYQQELYRLKPELEIGGAVRFNYNLSSWKEGQKKRGGDFDMMSFVSMQKPSTKELS
jgi:hypothetical protein